MKKIILGILSIMCATIIFANHPNSKTVCNPEKTPCLVIENKNQKWMPRNWRTTQLLAKHYKKDTTGLKELWISTSSEPNPKQFTHIKKKIERLTKNRVSKIIDVDLREETHGYLNGVHLSLRTYDNKANFELPYSKILAQENAFIQQLQESSEAIPILLKQHFKEKNINIFQTVKVKSASTEQETVEKIGLQYERILVTDHLAPRPEQVKKFVELVDSLPQNAWIHVHCSAGKGRSTTFMAMYDMLKNAKSVSFEDIIQRQAAYFPYYNLANVERTDPKRADASKKRYEFLKSFYQFSRNRTDKQTYETISI